MKAPRSDALFRMGGLAACVIVALPVIVRTLTGDVTVALRNAGVDDLTRIDLPARGAGRRRAQASLTSAEARVFIASRRQRPQFAALITEALMQRRHSLVQPGTLVAFVVSVGAIVTVAAMGGARAVNAQAGPAPTFYKDVLPILQKNCQSCHRPGQIGPMALLTYEQARPWARAIKAKLLAREMPPWFADPRYNRFSNDLRLHDRDLATVVSWVDGGAAAGEAKDAPPPVQWSADGWEIPPDVVVDAVEYKVPAKGIIEWLNVTVPSGFTKDTWVTTMEVRPGARAVVHHVCVSFMPHVNGVKYYVPEWTDKPRDEGGVELPRAAAARVAAGLRRDSLPGRRLHCYVPGVAAVDFRPYNAATLIPAGSDLSFSIHYNPNGTEAVDLTRIGFTMATEPPPRQFISVSLNPPRDRDHFAIPPHDANWQAPSAEARFLADAELVSLLYHMHDRGKDATTRLEYPDGRAETLLSVPKYDFNWQMTYAFAKPTRVPKGTKIRFDAHYDNTRRGGYLDPGRWVYWGDQTWEEMMGNWLGLVIDRGLTPRDVIEPLNKSSIQGGGSEG
jgi:hypothetical protein